MLGRAVAGRVEGGFARDADDCCSRMGASAVFGRACSTRAGHVRAPLASPERGLPLSVASTRRAPPSVTAGPGVLLTPLPLESAADGVFAWRGLLLTPPGVLLVRMLPPGVRADMLPLAVLDVLAECNSGAIASGGTVTVFDVRFGAAAPFCGDVG